MQAQLVLPLEIQFGDERLPERFWSKVKVADGGCWEWTAGKSDGYGRFSFNGVSARLAHRVAYETLVRPIPYGKQMDHLCRVRHCVNPLHLEAVTPQENVRRSSVATHARGAEYCRNGKHRLTTDNVTIKKSGIRGCRACQKAVGRRHRARMKGKP